MTTVAVIPIRMRPKHACAYLGMSMSKLYELLALGEIDSYTEGRARYITREALDDYARRAETKAGAR